MESNPPSRSKLKRPISEVSEDSDSDSDPGRPREEKRVRFPKGKKARPGDEAFNINRAPADDEVGIGLEDPRLAAKEREKRRSKRNHGKFGDDGTSEDQAEVEYEGLDYDNFVEDGIQLDPFNLDQEREEGYFDANGNFVEYANPKNQVKDAWLDSLEGAGGSTTKLYAPKTKGGDGGCGGDGQAGQDLPSWNDEDDIGRIKRRIADVLEEEETVFQALRRLKGNKKEKMPAEMKRVFDQLTEDSLTLMDKYGEYDVNQEKKEIFEREAQGYETLARARTEGLAAIANTNGGESAEDGYDMFGEDDNEGAIAQASKSDGGGGVGSSELQNDYVFDESSGYYYSSSLGYYYDPSTGLYCSAASGIWYKFNEETGAYDEITHHDQAEATAAAETSVN